MPANSIPRTQLLRPALRRARILPALFAAVGLCSCAKTDPASGEDRGELPFPLLVEARAENRTPVANVEILSGIERVGVTDATGLARFTLTGGEGERATLTVRCPAGFASPERPLVAGLRRLADGSPPPKFEVECVPLVHSVLVGIVAENGPGLPVLHLKKKVGQTDAHGIAHVLLPAESSERFTLTLDTSQNHALRPQNPSLSFVTQSSDELVLLEQKFAVQRVAVQARPRRRGPQPL